MQSRHFLIACMLGLSGCGSWTSFALTVTNRSHQPVSAISANFAGKVKRADRLIRGQYIVLASRGGKGGICLTFRQGSVLRRYSLAYLTENLPVHYQVTIRDHDISIMSNDVIDQTLGEPIVLAPQLPGEHCTSTR